MTTCMKPRERVLRALEHKEADIVPYNVTFTKQCYEKVVEYTGDPEYESKIGNHLVILETEPKMGWKEIEPDIWEDQFGVQWDRTVDKDIGVPRNRLITNRDELKNYQFPDPNDPTRFQEYPNVISQNRDKFIVANLGFSLFERAWSLCGMQELFMAMALDKMFVHDLLDRILEFNLKIIERACSYDIDCMRFGDDWGGQNGLLMSINMWREYIKPRVKEMYQLVKKHNKYVMIHSCGKVDELFPDLIEIGVDIFNPFQPEVMDIYRIKKEFGSDLVFYGGISVQKTLPFKSVDETRQEVRKLLAEIGKNGGYIASPSHDIPYDAKPENIVAMVEELRNQKI